MPKKYERGLEFGEVGFLQSLCSSNHGKSNMPKVEAGKSTQEEEFPRR